MKNFKKTKIILAISGMVDVILLDQITKYLAIREIIGKFTFIENFLYFIEYQKNDGIAFGIDLPRWIQIAGSLVVLFLLMNIGQEYIFKNEEKRIYPAFFFGAVIGGGISNLVDRIFHGYVVDFIVMRPFPVFNIADIGITVGLIVVSVTMLTDQNKLIIKNE